MAGKASTPISSRKGVTRKDSFPTALWADSTTNQNYCERLNSLMSLVEFRVASLVRVSRAIVEKIVASTQNTGPRMPGQTRAWPGTRTKNMTPVSAMPTVAKLIQYPQTLFLQFSVAATEMAAIEKNRRFHASWNIRPCAIDDSNDRPSKYTEYAARRCKQAQIM